MIRINLLGQTRPKERRETTLPLDATFRLGMLVAALVLAFGVLFVTYESQAKQLQQTNDKIQSLQAERARLQQIKSEVTRFEAQKQVLQNRINVIETLQKGRTGGQEMLQAVANTVARSEGVWLTSLSKTGGTLSMDGEASSVNSVANFLTQMKRTGYFDKIEIKETKENDLVKSVPTFSFSVTADIATTESVPASTTPPGAAPRGRS
jgi:type IV pilus assembly protein PilN